MVQAEHFYTILKTKFTLDQKGLELQDWVQDFIYDDGSNLSICGGK